MKRFALCFFVLAGSALFSAPAPGAAPWIVEDGQPRAEIVVAEKPARAAEFGACELQNYIEKITGCQLKIVAAPSGSVPVHIYVGESVAARRVGCERGGSGSRFVPHGLRT